MAKAIKGQLKKENFGYSMPGDAPLYNKPPIYYKNVEVTLIPFETDAKAAAAMLPEGLELAPTATAAVLFVNYNFSSLGAYTETILSIDCLFEGAPKAFFPHIVVGGNEVPLAAGREIWGYSKKLADIQITREGDLTLGTMERPRGNRIVTGIFKPEVRVPDAEIPLAPVSLRVIPGADSDEPALAELIEAPCSMTNLDLWMGTGSLQFNSTSAFDPWHKLEIKNVLPSMYLNYDAELGLPIVLKRY